MTQTIADPPSAASSSPNEAVASWLGPFTAAVSARDVDRILELFVEDCWWRDLIAMSWDLQTLHGAEQIRLFLKERLAVSGIGEFALWDEADSSYIGHGDGTGYVETFLKFRTDIGWGLAVAKLVEADGRWKAYTVMTSLQELDNRPLAVGENRSVVERVPVTNWAARRRQEMEFDEDPEVIVLGAGHAGLSAAAYLHLSGVRTLVLERLDNVGDVWRNRYDALVVHDPAWMDELAFMPFPDSWPVYTPKDKLGDWFEMYAKALDLNVWTGTEMTSVEYSREDERWTVGVRRPDGTARTLKPRHFVMAVGHVTEPRIPEFAGQDEFGGTVLHTSQFVGGRDWEDKKAVVVGTGNSGQDIAKDLYDQGAAKVTMVQRSPTYIITQKYSQPVLNSVYMQGAPLRIADLRAIATPFGQMIEMAPEFTRQLGELDKEVTHGLTAAGFQVDDGSVSGGLVGLGLSTSGGYVIDVGSGDYIIDGRIAIAAGQIRRFVRDGLELADGTKLEADLVVLATGFKNMHESARLILGNEIAGQTGPVWGLDEGNELNAVWRPCGFPNLWFTAGSFPYSRIYSRFLAIQIAADLDGLRS